MSEKWLPVVGFEGLYEVSDLGRVRSLVRSHAFGENERPEPYYVVGARQKGRRRVALARHGEKPVYVTVASIVMAAFGPPKPEGTEICHGPHGVTDDGIANLRWDTRKANMADKKRDGTFVAPPVHIGTAHPRAIFTEDDIRCIRAEPVFRGVGLMLAKAFGTNPSTISCIRNRQTWAHVEQYL